MPNAPQTQNPSTPNMPSANQSKTAPVGDNMKKDEPTAGKSAGGMQDKSASASGDKPKSSNL